MSFYTGNQLNDNDAKYLAEALKNNVTLANLDLSNNEFGETGGMHLAAGLVCVDILIMNVYECDVADIS